MQRVYKNLIIISLSFLSLVTTNAQKSNMSFRHLTTENGLSQNTIFAILQDRQGFMWFATPDGLNRYDGNSFVVYKNNPDDSTSIGENFTMDVVEDKDGNLWIGCHTGGMNKFDPQTGRFTRFINDPDNPNSISGNYINCLTSDNWGHIWIGTTFTGLNQYDPATNKFTCYRYDSNGHFVGRITDVIAGSKGDIWFVGNLGLFHLNTQTGQITRPSATIDRVSADNIFEDKLGNLWMLAWNPESLVKYEPQVDRLTRYPLEGIGGNRSTLLDDGQNGFWIPTRRGLFHFDRETERFSLLFQHDETNPRSLNDNTIVSVFKDKGGLLWLGTGNGGLNILNFQQEQFGFYKHAPTLANSLSPGRVNDIYEDSNGILWLGFYPRALDRFDRKTGKITHFAPGRANENNLGKGHDVNSIHKDEQGYLWLGGWESGLVRFDERSGQFKHYRHDPTNPNSLLSNCVINVFEDKNGYLWIGQDEGASRLDWATGKFTHYRHNPDNTGSLGDNSVSCIFQDRSGRLWFGTWGGVLCYLVEKTETFVNYFPDSHNPKSLNGGAIYTLHEDRNGTLWVGTTDGLYRFQRDKGAFTRYTYSQGLPSSNIQGILDDNSGRLWISTKNGLSRFDPKKGTFKNYDKSDGLQDNDFSQNCCAYGQNGEMFFGGSKGFNAFFPENIKSNSYIPPVVLSDFQLFNMPVPIGENSPLKKAINVADQITLRYDQQVFSFKFAALSYNSPWKNQYAFKLEGFDKDWRYTGADNPTATYTRLSPGNYIFHVKASNNDGVWNEKGTSIKITIIPPWWGTWWFRSVLVLTLLALAYSIHLLRVMNIKKYNWKLEKEVAERTEQLDVANKELNVVNDELETTNESLLTVNKELEAFSYSVSHDLRAPLRHIEAFSQILFENYQNKIDDQGKSYLHRIQKSTLRMSQLIEDMLSLSRISRSEMTVQDVNLGTIAREIADNLLQSQPNRVVNFSICGDLTVRGDSRLLRIVLENLIGNAWKYTSKHPTANIEVGFKKQNNTTIYYVRDDGAGFNMNYAQKLFGVFQRLHRIEEFEGTGVGLATVARIINKHGGKVWAEGEVEKGATFYFTLF